MIIAHTITRPTNCSTAFESCVGFKASVCNQKVSHHDRAIACNCTQGFPQVADAVPEAGTCRCYLLIGTSTVHVVLGYV